MRQNGPIELSQPIASGSSPTLSPFTSRTSSPSLNRILNFDSPTIPSSQSAYHSDASLARPVDLKGKGKAIDQDATRPSSSDGITKSLESLGLQVPDDGVGGKTKRVELVYRTFQDEETDLRGIMELCEEELSEPYVFLTLIDTSKVRS